MIERGQTEAIQLVRDTVNSRSGTLSEVNMGNATTTVPPLVYVDEDGLEEQFLTEDEATQEIAEVTANRVTTPVEPADVAPLDPIYTQRSQQEEDFDLQPSTGPRGESLLNVMEQFLDDNYEDVLRTSNMQTDFSMTTHNSIPGKTRLHLSWIVRDGTNRKMEEIRDQKKSDGTPGGGSSGSVVVNLPRIEPYYGTQFFLVDMDTGELSVFVQQQWRRTGLFCSRQPFVITQLMEKVKRMGQIMQAELEAEQQTPVISIGRTPGQFEVPAPLPMMDEPEVYVIQPDVMDTNMCKNYVRDRMSAALIYISEYAETQKMLSENKYWQEDLLVRLRAVSGRVDRIGNHIDQALQYDDAHRRRRDMRFLLLPTRFLRPESMGQGDITVWTNWIREETTAVMNQLDEELEARGDPDDPFNGSADGVYQPLPTSFSLPPPAQTPRRREVSKSQEHSQNSLEREWRTRRVMNTSSNIHHVEPTTQAQAARCESEEHSLDSLNPSSGSEITAKPSTQLQQDGVLLRHEEDIPVQENNLITFTPLPGPGDLQESREGQPSHKPKGQRTPRRRRTHNSEWDLNQRHFSQSKPQEISHISPVEQVNVYNTEELSVSYLQLPTRRTTDSQLCSKCGNPGHWRKYCQATTWCRFCTSETHSTQVCRKYTKMIQLHQAEEQLLNSHLECSLKKEEA